MKEEFNNSSASTGRGKIEPHDSARVFLIAVLVNLAVQFAFSFVVAKISFDSAETETLVNLFGSVLIQAAYAGVYFYVVKHKNTQPVFRPSNPIKPVPALLSAAAAICLLLALYLPTLWVDALLVRIGFVTPPLVLNPLNLTVCVFAVVLAAPMIEELIFRGAMLSGLYQNGKMKGVLITAAAFMLMHFNPSQTFFQFFVGLLCGLAVVYTGSFWAGVIAHAVNNLLALLLGVTPLAERLDALAGYFSGHIGIAAAATAGMLAVFGALTVLILRTLKRQGEQGKTPSAAIEKQTEQTKTVAESESGQERTDQLKAEEFNAALLREKNRFGRAYLLLGFGIAATVWVTVLVSTILS